jgi:hypothetical protein
MSDHVFGYGSLVLDGTGSLETLPGHRRVWGVATDNVRHIPGYKKYLSREDGSRPGVYVAFVDIVPDPDSSVKGLVRPLAEGELRELDARERNYDRVDVTELIAARFDGPVWTYRGSPEGRQRLLQGREEGRAVISRDYLAKVRLALEALGDNPPETDLPVWDLERVDL